SSRLFLAGCSPAEPASASPADATLRLHPPQCQRNFIERYFVTVLVVSAQGSTAKTSVSLCVCGEAFGCSLRSYSSAAARFCSRKRWMKKELKSNPPYSPCLRRE